MKVTPENATTTCCPIIFIFILFIYLFLHPNLFSTRNSLRTCCFLRKLIVRKYVEKKSSHAICTNMLEIKQNDQHLNNVIVIIRVIGIWCYKINHLYPEQQKYISIYCFDLETLIYVFL